MSFNLFFVVSRDWQVRRDHQIGLEMSKRIPNLDFHFISEELWTLGNASSEVSRLGTQETLIVPRDVELGLPVWLSLNPMGDLGKIKKDFADLLEEFDAKFDPETKRVLVYDGFGPTIDGVPSQVYSNWFTSSNSHCIFLQHGYLPGNFWYLVTTLKIRLHRATRGKRSIGNIVGPENYTSLVFDKYSFFVAILSGSKIRNTKIVGNYNLLGLRCAPFGRNEERVIESGVIIYSTGSYKNENIHESKEFEEFVARVKKCMEPDQVLWIKFKSGELKMMSHLSKVYFEDLGVHFAPENLRMSDLSDDVLIMASSASNVGMEVLAEGKSLVLYTLKFSGNNILKKHYRKLGISQFNPDVRLTQQLSSRKSFDQKSYFDSEIFFNVIKDKLEF